MTDLLELDAQQGAVVGNECPSVIVYPADLRSDQLEAFQRQIPAQIWLPDNQRGDSAAFNGERVDGDPAEIEP